MGSIFRNLASAGLKIPTLTGRSISRHVLWMILAAYLEHSLCVDIWCCQFQSSSLDVDPSKLEHKLFVFAGPFSCHYQQSIGKGREE